MVSFDVQGWYADLTSAERGVSGFLAVLAVLVLVGILTGGLSPTYLLYLLSLVGMYVLLSLGLNVHWGYTGLINFSVAAFFGLGAYGTALMTAGDSPIAGQFLPIFGLFAGLALAGVLAVLIGYPTLSLREDYLAIASLGLAEVVRLVVLNQIDWTNGSSGISQMPGFFEGWPVLSTLPSTMPTLTLGSYRLGYPFWQAVLNVSLVAVFVVVAYLLLRRVHRSPWGRVLRTIRSDEDLAEALGKDTFAFRMQAFVIGSLIMALAGVFYAHLTLYVNPGLLEPIYTFYVWIAVILGGSGSNRGAVFGGLVIVAIQEGTRFLNGALPDTVGSGAINNLYTTVFGNFGSVRLLIVGLLIIAIMRYRPSGVLPPQRELIWPDAVEESPRERTSAFGGEGGE
ncbi:MAG: branched-chain amino acid ABC transporter permease [Halanaeroarchaeum sp.]